MGMWFPSKCFVFTLTCFTSYICRLFLSHAFVRYSTRLVYDIVPGAGATAGTPLPTPASSAGAARPSSAARTLPSPVAAPQVAATPSSARMLFTPIPAGTTGHGLGQTAQLATPSMLSLTLPPRPPPPPTSARPPTYRPPLTTARGTQSIRASRVAWFADDVCVVQPPRLLCRPRPLAPSRRTPPRRCGLVLLPHPPRPVPHGH